MLFQTIVKPQPHALAPGSTRHGHRPHAAMQFAVGRHSPSRFMYPEWSGLYMEGKQGLYVNVGLGYIGLMPLRFGAWPEITVITLKQLKMEN